MRLKNHFLTVAVSAAGVSVFVQLLAFARQVLVAAYFGIERSFDTYVIVYTIATVAVFTFGAIFDSIAVPHLVRARESSSPETARALARSIFHVSLWMGGATSLLFLIAVPLLAPIVATGFSAEERIGLGHLAWYFLPWTLVCVPYYAAAARHKMEWRFNRVFSAEISIVVVSIGFLLFWHDDVRMLPLAYGSGYAVGLVYLGAGIPLVHRASDGLPPSVRPVLRNIGELFLANQTGGLTGIVDRHIQSFLAAGGIAAVNYSSQITTSLASLLTFREIYIVPLTQKLDRAERLERLLSGLLLVAVPLSGLISLLAPDIVKVLLERGRFDAAATALTADVLRIGALSLVTASVMTPLARMFQITDRIYYTHIMYLAVAVSLAIFGYLFVFVLGWGVRGVALMQLTSGVVSAILTSYLVGRCGIHLRWRSIVGRFSLAAVVSVAACLAALAATSALDNVWGRLLVGGAIYGLIVLVCYFLARAQLSGIVFGSVSTEI